MRHVLATIAGIIDAFIIVFIFDFLAHTLYPVEFDVMTMDLSQMGFEIDKIPNEKFYITGLGHFLGFVAGMGLSSIISKTSRIPALIVSGLLLIGITFNLFTLPHPLIFDYIEIAAIALGFTIGWMITKKIVKKDD